MLPSLSSLSLSHPLFLSECMNTHPSWSSYVYSLFIKIPPYWAPRQIKNMSADQYRAVMFAWGGSPDSSVTDSVCVCVCQ